MKTARSPTTRSSAGAGTFVFTVDQKATSGSLQLLGSVPSDGSPITVTVSQNDDSGVLRADAVRLDADGWRSSGLGGLYAAGPVWAEYNFSLAGAGTQEILVSTPGHSNSTSSAVYTITNNGSQVASFTTSQKSSTDGFETLGYIEAAAGDLTVRVTNGSSGYLRTDQLQVRDVIDCERLRRVCAWRCYYARELPKHPGLKRRPIRRGTAEEIQQVVAMRAEGMTLHEIALTMDRNLQCVARWLKKHAATRET